MKNYKYFGHDSKSVSPVNKDFMQIKNQQHLYDILRDLWSSETCAPRMRNKWTKENKTLGQCSITAFLVQDIFGGEVYGIKRPDGNFHCYNVIGDSLFDLTSEQFGNEVLNYENNPEQFREIHFSKVEKFERYKLLKSRLLDYLK